MRTKQSWFRMPDFFATLILTRPNADSQRFLTDLGDAVPCGVQVVVSALLDIVPTGAVADLSGVQGVIFTSANGVRLAGPGRNRRAFCVGPATTAVAARAGWAAQQSGDTAEALIQTLTRQRPSAPLIHVCGVHRRGQVAERLTRAGIATRAVAVYDQARLPLSAPAKDALRGSLPVIVPLFSPRAAAHFADLARPCAPLHIVALSDAVLAETRALTAAARLVAAAPNAQSMGDTVANLLRRVEAGHAPQ